MILLRRIKRILLATVVVVSTTSLLTGCGAKKSTTTDTSTPLPAQTGLNLTESECVSILDKYGQWEQVRIPLNLKLRQPKSMSMSASATMERGKSITISLRFIGMEVGVAYLTSDSLLAIDKFNKRYVSEAVKPLLGGFPANISNLQDLLLGRPFLLGNEKPLGSVTNKFDIDPQLGSDSWSLIPKSFPNGVEYGFSFNPIDALSLLIVKAGSHEPVEITFAKPESTPSGPMSPSVSIAARLGKTMVDATLEWNFNKAKWNEGTEVKKPTIPRGAERIQAAKLLKSFP